MSSSTEKTTEKPITDKLKVFAGMVEKFVENNLMEKEQRDENLKKLAIAFETFIKDNPFRQNFKNFRESQAAANRSQEAASADSVKVLIKKLENFKGELPKYQSSLASGFDVRAQIDQAVDLLPGQRALISTGLAFAIPEGYEIQARPRSGLAIRDGISLVNTPGTIDADYRGEVKIILINLGDKTVTIQDQDRIAQLVLAPVFQAQFEVVENLDVTQRGAGGFGSTGKA